MAQSTIQNTRRSALSDIKRDAEAKRFISDKTRLQVLYDYMHVGPLLETSNLFVSLR